MNPSASSPRQGGILRPALVVFAALSLVTGLAYPFLTSGIAAAVFPHEAAGSLIKQGERLVGSELIGQEFSSPGYFWGRPSATAPMPYNAAGSGGSNLGPRNPALAEAIQARIAALKAADPGNPLPVPAELLTASGSGLDPHISPAAAAYQAARVARARQLPREQVDALIRAHTDTPWLGLLGDPTVNVLTLNLALDQLPAAR
ncbi:potassium-transporting ATPase subunit C [Achromobacter denitrificans]|jgi:K+-transporting ATPase ATPase C chain|uniref:potassium-transporting ATPase subunit KdpC n=1 Tax=Achromobacter denitrificans TaxID=32002 RepID=UPI000788455A|nr:potassium-transporting ATPase subunit KdpC [Achromobacter denitrificans]OLU09934.1 potassium-transporting ATPase subunit C [Achromobacter denitrificans]QKH45210.1 potassium-transporting ATPase subunit KdpC [Achromobacter denitrificans]QKH53448.1 potassium-transporting ATPase subunit KdpC [Achromobacter denitrificans]CAB3670464.1 Potassium-transporting ATPase KdpC subunit [Achromobacter denitrificans]SUW34287.1 potassium-transporting ATPase subunit C [Achromobacter denitrificans]